MHIFYHETKGALYARLGRSVRNGDKVSKESVNLGRVIDKEKGIYKSRERGVFQYDLETDTYTSISAPEGEPERSFSGMSEKPGRSGKTGKGGSRSSGLADELGAEKSIVDLGDVFFLDSFLQKEGLDEIIDGAGYEDRDTLYTILCYRLLNGGDDCRAADWYEGSYASVLYPHARLAGQQLREMYAVIGGEPSQQFFFSRYLSFMSQRLPGGRQADGCVLIDSAGEREGRLLYVVRQSTGMPVYFRYCEDKEADVDTLVRTIRELEVYKIFIRLAILDAGYYSGDSIEELYAHGIAFLTKPREDLRLYKKLATESLSALAGQENFVSCDRWYPYIKCVPCKVGQKNHPACAYVCLALDPGRIEAYRQLLDAKNRSLTDGDMHDMIQSREILLFVSSERIAPDKLFSAYGARWYMEQLFRPPHAGRSFGRGGGQTDPWAGRTSGQRPGEQTKDMVRGQLLLTFMADVIRKQIEDRLQGMPYTLDELFLSLRNQKGKVYRDRVVAQKASKKASDCYKRFKLPSPAKIGR